MNGSTSEFVQRHTRELADATRWHRGAPDAKTLACRGCGYDTTFVKSLWLAGRYTCATCGWNIDEPWRSA